jgi:hypothetical protein
LASEVLRIPYDGQSALKAAIACMPSPPQALYVGSFATALEKAAKDNARAKAAVVEIALERFLREGEYLK